MSANCLFCKIIKGQIPSFKLFETPLSYAFLDIGPISRGHCLVIPKYHSEFMHEQPDESLADLLPIVKKLAIALGGAPYNVVQNNGELAYQSVKHVHFHVIPKTVTSGLKLNEWNTGSPSKEELAALCEEIKSKF